MLADGIYISDLPTLEGAVPNTSVVAVDDGTTTKQATTNQVAKAVVENYTGSSLAGTAQSIKSAIDSLGTDMGDLSDLDTTDKSSLVNAINEVATTPSVSPYDTDPEMDGTASPGESDEYARGDHVHPSDTTKADAEEVEADIEAINTALDTKADTDGMYEDMSVGNLISTQFVENKEPYLFRRTGNGKNIDGSEKAFIDKIIGGTVAWNQLMSNDLITTITFLKAFSAGTPLISGHKYLVLYDAVPINGSTASSAFLYLRQNGETLIDGAFLANNTTKKASIYNATASGIADGNSNSNNGLWVYMSGELNDTNFSSSYFNFIDLTAFFGSAEIADYIYSLEQTTAGAGVAWLKSHGFLTKDYYAYDSGSLQSVKTSEHRTSGKNLLSIEANTATVSGVTFTQSADGSITVNGTATSNFIYQIKPTSSYDLLSDIFDIKADTAYILSGCPSGGSLTTYRLQLLIHGSGNEPYDLGSGSRQFSFTASDISSKEYRLGIRVDSGTVCNNLVFKPMVRLASVSDATWQPYEVHSYPLDSDLELRGLFKLDANNNLYADGDVYPPSGEVSRRYTIVDMGTLNWSRSKEGDYYRFNCYAGLPDAKANTLNFICSKGYQYDNLATASGTSDKSIQIYGPGKFLLVRDDAYSSASDFATAMSGVYLVYEKETPTTETAQSYASPQVVSPLGTEEYVDTRDVPVPVGHETKYMANLREKIEDLPWDLSMIAPIENGTTASRAYSTGQYFLKDNQFCKALTSIASGATFTLNTNYAVTTVADELYTALHS